MEESARACQRANPARTALIAPVIGYVVAGHVGGGTLWQRISGRRR